jgi:glycosyltransferase involved in cell wall biosynthesis
MNNQKSFKLSSVSFFCPAYNDEGNLPDLIPNVFKFLSENSEKFEIIIIDDGGPDKTGEVADELAQRFPNTRVIHHSQNKGYTATLKEGFETGKYDFVCYTDGDNQYDINDLGPYLYLLQNNDVIAGYATKKAVSNFRKFQSWVHNTLINILFLTHFRDINAALKIFKKPVLDKIKINSSPYGAFIDAELILKAHKLGFKIAQFPVIHYERKSGVASGSKPKVILNTIKDMVKLRLNLL